MNRNLIMGVINITPDSFSDGGRFVNIRSALEQVDKLLSDGADIIDIGAESSRPGARPITEDEEWQRLSPVLEELKRLNIGQRISIDTYKPGIMRRVADCGVGYINNIMGLTDSQSLIRLSQYPNLNYIAMHIHGIPESMQVEPLSASVAIAKVQRFFSNAKDVLQTAGFDAKRIWLDPGIGFGKSDAANIHLLQYCLQHAATEQMLVGISRKGFIGRLLEIEQPQQRDNPSKTLEFALMAAGISIIRTHEVAKLAKFRDLLESPA